MQTARRPTQTRTISTRDAIGIAQNFTYACEWDALYALEGMARAAANDDALDLWATCAQRVDDALAKRTASDKLLGEVMSLYPTPTAGNLVSARDAWYDKIASAQNDLDHTITVINALDNLARNVLKEIGDDEAQSLQQQASAWRHASRIKLFWANVEAACLRIGDANVAGESIRAVFTAMRNDSFGSAVSLSGLHPQAFLLLANIFMDLGDVLGPVGAMDALTAAIERACAPQDCTIAAQGTD